MAMAFDLDDTENAAWESAYASARKASEAGDHRAAFAWADQAWLRIPEPRWQCSVAYITTLRRIAVRYKASDWLAGADVARAAAEDAWSKVQVPVFQVLAGIGLYEAGDHAEAMAYFGAAYTASGDFGFKGEDPKYLAFYRAGK